jgi:purine-binding chemotaxis protein CheW
MINGKIFKMNDFDIIQKEFDEDVEKHQYLTFLLSNEIFAIEVLKVKEIIGFGLITPVPSMPKYIEGVVNVRGNVLPVISLNKRFNLKSTNITKKTCIIIVSAMLEEDMTDIGLVVDMVNQVYDILPHNIEDTPMFGSAIRKDFILKIGKVNKKFISILDINGVVNLHEISTTIDKKYI